MKPFQTQGYVFVQAQVLDLGGVFAHWYKIFYLFLVFTDSRGQIFSLPATRKQRISQKKPGCCSVFPGKDVQLVLTFPLNLC